MAKKKAHHNCILSAVLAFVLLFGALPLSVFSTDNEEKVTPEAEEIVAAQAENLELYITADGQRVESVRFARNEKVTAVAEGLVEGADYQWQIKMPEEETWVDIYEHDEMELTLSYPMLWNMMDSANQATVRCVAYINGLDMFYTDPLPVTVDTDGYVEYLPEEQEKAESAQEQESLTEETVEPAEEETEPTAQTTEPEEVTEPVDAYSDANAVHSGSSNEIFTIKIEYRNRDRDGSISDPIWDPYEASVQSGTPFKTTVNNRTVPGREPVLADDSPAGATLVKTGTTSYLEIDLASVTENVTYVVYYEEVEVSYHARYFLQNVGNDLYTEDTTYYEEFKGFPGDEPSEAAIKKPITGFTALFHQPDSIAADGSTVFEVYYDRNYYLINFNLDGGFGTGPVYARYGTTFTVAQPEKPGYVFKGWNLISVNKVEVPNRGDENGNGVIDDNELDPLPGKVPAENRTYQAVWDTIETTYSVVYWIVNDDGTSSYLGSRTAKGISGDTASGEHDLDTKANGGPAICGSEEHTHSDACYVCGFATEHKHTQGCFDGMTLASVPGTDNNRDAAIADLEGGAPESGYIYVIFNPDSKTYWPKLYMEDNNGNGTYYVINDTQGGSTVDSFSAIVDGDPIASKTGTYGTETLTTTKYRPKTSCNTIQHIHDDYACRVCEEHTHSNNCYQNARYLEEVNTITLQKDGEDVTYTTDTNVLIKGDGSSVVNVYYQYKEYTLKFYYAATTGGTANDNDKNAATYDSVKVLGGTSYYFGSWGPDTSDDEELLEEAYWDHSDQWGTVSALPTLNENGEDKEYTKGSVTYTRNNTQVQYHYISFKARYDDDISEMWPCAVFNSATRTTANTHGYWSGREAFVSAWNGEHHVRYSKVNSNQTIKGIYEKLDENLLFHSDYTDESEVSYICFWENGANVNWSVPELYRYNIYLEVRANQDTTGLTTVTKNDGKTYYLASSYDTCDDSHVDAQTQAAMTGYTQKTFGYNSHSGYSYMQVRDSNPAKYFEYKKLTGTTDAALLAQSGYYDESLYKEGYEVNFYYTANKHSFKFWNYTGWLGAGKGAGNTQEGQGVQFGTPLENYGQYVNETFMAQPANYPKNLEKDAYVFEGWYTSPLFLPGTEMNWNTTMPDEKLTVYAKWVPITHDVRFYLSYDEAKNAPAENDFTGAYAYRDNTVHGQVMTGTIDIPTHTDPRYRFVGWFYMDNGVKTAFDPSEMTVQQDMDIFAEWATSITTQYTISYARDDNGNAGAPLSEDTTGYIFVGTTKTFTAKPKEKLELLTDTERESLWLPHTNSHSILMKELAEDNTFTFRYVTREKAPYKVYYLDAETGDEVLPTKVVDDNKKAVVTEQFVYKEGYTTPPFNQTLVLSANEKENVIVFYYTKNPEGTTDQVAYLATHYTEDLWEPDGERGKYSEYTSNSHLAELNTEVNEGQLTIPGFTYNADKSTATGKVVESGLELELYYTRNTYPYVVKYIDRTTGKALTYKDSSNKDVEYTKVVTDIPYERNVSEQAVDVVGYNLYSKQTQTLKIGVENGSTAANITKNVITFYYEPKQITIDYKLVCTEETDVTFGYVSQSKEIKNSLENIGGSDAWTADGFSFKGWYLDEKYTQPVPEGWVDNNDHLRPQITNQDLAENKYEYTYYAVFEPVKEDLKITKQAAAGTDLGNDTFLFRITGTNALGKAVDMTVSIQGSNSVTIKDLYCGKYTVTELTNWSWTYSGEAAKNVELVADDAITETPVTFTNSAEPVDWLHGESDAEENQFTVKEKTP